MSLSRTQVDSASDLTRSLRSMYFSPDVQPLLVVEWRDRESSATGYLAVQSLRGGACGGGTRVRAYRVAEEAREAAVLLAKTMELKFLVSGLGVGGAKSVINCPESILRSSDRAAVQVLLRRWFGMILPHLKHCYGTGPDENTNDSEICRLLASLGVPDPRLGVAVGRYGDHVSERLQAVRVGVAERVPHEVLRLSIPFSVGDAITGYGIAAAIQFYYSRRGECAAEKRVAIEGFGAVGTAAALFLQAFGANIVAVSSLSESGKPEHRNVLVARDGTIDVAAAISHRVGSSLLGETICHDVDRIWDFPIDVFVAAATSKTLTVPMLEVLLKNGVQLVACGANEPFATSEAESMADSSVVVLPDFIANCGMARTYAYLLEHFELPARIWEHVSVDVKNTIERALSAGQPEGELKQGVLSRSYDYWIRLAMAPTGTTGVL